MQVFLREKAFIGCQGFEITDAMRDSIVRLARAQVGRRYFCR